VRVTVTVRPLTAESVTANPAVTEPVLPSVTAALLMLSVGAGSSSSSVAAALVFCSVVLTAFDRANAKTSSASSSASGLIGTVTVREVAHAGNVTVPCVAV